MAEAEHEEDYNGAVVYGIASRRRTLEERFIEIMGADQRPG
jgi:hypothetical protein